MTLTAFNVNDKGCMVKGCPNPTFAYCMNSMFTGRICEACFAINSPLWDKAHDKEIEDYHAKEEVNG